MKNRVLALLSALTISSSVFGGYFMNENGEVEGYLQENGEKSFIFLDKEGNTKGFIQENGEDNYLFLGPEGQLEGFYQED